MKIEIYDPPMCCSTGVCGPSVDPVLVRVSADLDWLKRQGVDVSRHNLSQEPAAFVASPVVKAALAEEGNECLPLTVVDGAVRCKGHYPSREQLAGFAGIELRASLMTDAVRELVAIGASIVANCEPCLKHHVNQARQLGVSKDDMRQAVDMAQMVKDSPAHAMLVLADRLLRDPLPMAAASSCCSNEESAAPGDKCCG